MKFYSKVMTRAVIHDETIRVVKEQNYAEIYKSLQDENVQKQKTASELLEIFFGAAMFYNASDIHLEPEEHF